MILKANSKLEQILFGELPEGYPKGNPLDVRFGVPILLPTEMHMLPSELISCNNQKSSPETESAGIHFYKADRRFMSVITNPLSWVERLSRYKCVLTPDISIGDGMPSWIRNRNTVLSRAAGAVWQSRGLNVIPSLRWRDESDYDLVAAGIASRSVFAVSNYGSRRNHKERTIFEDGLLAMISRLEPEAVLIFGSVDSRLSNLCHGQTQLIEYHHEMTKKRLAAKTAPEVSNLLFY